MTAQTQLNPVQDPSTFDFRYFPLDRQNELEKTLKNPRNPSKSRKGRIMKGLRRNLNKFRVFAHGERDSS